MENENIVEDWSEFDTPAEETNSADEVPASEENSEQTGQEVKPESVTGEEEKQENESKDNTPPEWAKKRIDKLTWEKKTAAEEAAKEKQRADALQHVIDQYIGGSGSAVEQPQAAPQQPSGQYYDAAAVQELAKQQAQQLFKAQEFNNRCNQVAEKGRSEFKDFDIAVQNLGAAGVTSPEFLDVATRLPDAHKVIQYLGKNPEKAMSLASLDPVSMAIELTRISTEAARLTAPPVSKAPAPISPVDANSTSNADNEPDPQDTAKWIAWFDRQEAKKARRY